MSDVSLFYHNGTERGPGKVVSNLIHGLLLNGHSVHTNTFVKNSLFGCLQPVNGFYNLPEGTVFGPNWFVLPNELSKETFEKNLKHLVVPSDWVKQVYEKFAETRTSTIDVWPVGIDVDTWKESSCEKGFGILYFKNRGDKDLAMVKKLIEKSGLRYQLFEYGKYKEEELLAACAKASFAVLLTGTESQGIAYMQMLSSGIPCYVFNCSRWKYGMPEKEYSATSVPYFSEKCGIAANVLSLSHFNDTFISCLEQFQPREYILENHTLEKSAEKYVEILRKYQEV